MSGELDDEIAQTRDRLARLEASANRHERGETCSPATHEWRGRQSMIAVGGGDAFRKRVAKISGVELDHAGYVLLECISCGAWGLRDYCDGYPIHDITAEAAQELL